MPTLVLRIVGVILILLAIAFWLLHVVFTLIFATLIVSALIWGFLFIRWILITVSGKQKETE